MKYDKIRGDVYLFCTPTPVKNHDLHIWSWHSDRTRTVALSLSGTGWYSGHSIGSLHCDSHVRPANGAGGWMWSHALVPWRRTISDNQAISRATSSFSKCSVMRMSLKITPEVTCKQQIGWISCACHAVWFLKSGVGQRIRFHRSSASDPLQLKCMANTPSKRTEGDAINSRWDVFFRIQVGAVYLLFLPHLQILVDMYIVDTLFHSHLGFKLNYQTG